MVACIGALGIITCDASFNSQSLGNFNIIVEKCSFECSCCLGSRVNGQAEVAMCISAERSVATTVHHGFDARHPKSHSSSQVLTND
jgi:hypothetical protein